MSCRGSHDDWCTRAAHSAGDGSAEPGGSTEKYPPAGGGDDELPDGGSWIGDGGCVVVVVVVVGAVVVGAGCVVVGADVDVGRCTVATVVVELWRYHRPWLYQLERLRRCAEATGIEIASTTDTAVITTIAVRSLRLILTLLSTAGFAPSRRPWP